jgi:hypothetical protein
MSGDVRMYTWPSNGTKHPMIKTWQICIQCHKMYRAMVWKYTCTPRIMIWAPFIGEVFRRSLFDTTTFNLRYYVSLSTTLIPQLQFRHLRSLVCLLSFGQSAFTMYRRCCRFAETLLQSPKTTSVIMTSIRLIKHKSPKISASSNTGDTENYSLHVCIPWSFEHNILCSITRLQYT